MEEEKGTLDAFRRLTAEIVESEAFHRMREYRHHRNGTTYEHSIRVAYLCYCHCRRHAGRLRERELIRGALLHDYFLYDRHDKENRISGLVHGFTHPRRALENAVRAYPDLSETERDIIRHHMFPMTPVPPQTRCGWLVCFYDKVAAISEYCGLGARKKSLLPRTQRWRKGERIDDRILEKGVFRHEGRREGTARGG